MNRQPLEPRAPKPLHPADVYDREQVARAVQFRVHFRKSAEHSITHPFERLADARAWAAEVERCHGQFGRRAAIYAMMPEGNQIMVPQDYPA